MRLRHVRAPLAGIIFQIAAHLGGVGMVGLNFQKAVDGRYRLALFVQRFERAGAVIEILRVVGVILESHHGEFIDAVRMLGPELQIDQRAECVIILGMLSQHALQLIARFAIAAFPGKHQTVENACVDIGGMQAQVIVQHGDGFRAHVVGCQGPRPRQDVVIRFGCGQQRGGA